MEYLSIKNLNNIQNNNLPDESYTSILNNFPRLTLNFVPWPGYPYKPLTQFSITHNERCIYLRFYVTEKAIRAVNTTINSSVWEDSCVEFFIAFDDTGYYNLECNCIGTALLGYGKDKYNRNLLPVKTVAKIKTHAVIIEQTTGGISWELAIAIPVEVFIHHQIESLRGKECSANFFKCGDLLPEPHFLAWNNILYPEPNFHLPEFFGKLHFE